MTFGYRATIFVDTYGVAMTSRVFFIHAAIEELQSTGFLSERTLNDLDRDEYNLVMERAQSKDNA